MAVPLLPAFARCVSCASIQPLSALLATPLDYLGVLAEMSWDTLLLIAGLAFIAVAILGNISGKISPGTEGRIAAALVGTGLLSGGIWYHSVLHGFKITGSLVATPHDISGPCPLTVPLQGVVDGSGTGAVIYDFIFSTGNASDLQTLSFSGSSQLVTGKWEIQKSIKDAWVRLHVAAPSNHTSPKSEPFTVLCLNAGDSARTPPVTPVPTGDTVAAAPVPGPSPAVADPAPAPPVHVTAPFHVINDAADSVSIDSVSPAPGVFHLATGQSVPFTLNITYNLVSADTATLSVSTAQFRSSPATCAGPEGELVDAVTLPIVRGRHQTVARLAWSGDTGVATKGDIFGRGYVSFTPMFWAASGKARSRLAFFGTYTEYCYRFGN